ncbi:hypothetical protein ABW20_dc0103259 [Dactylellina cionopaga]|nr:hypothetical protein ABW20_dc0103259 [Dactylellina cionopaga]
MRFTSILSALAAISAVVAHPASEPEPKAAALPNKGEPYVIRLKDIDPKAKNGDLVVGKIRITSNATVAENTLTKRESVVCYNTAHWVSQSSLYLAKNGLVTAGAQRSGGSTTKPRREIGSI